MTDSQESKIVADARYSTFINVFNCRPEDQDAVVRINVDIVERVAKRCEGFVSASVHRSTGGTRVFNYLQWETPEHLIRMQQSAEFAEIAKQFAGLIEFEPHAVVVSHVASR